MFQTLEKKMFHTEELQLTGFNPVVLLEHTNYAVVHYIIWWVFLFFKLILQQTVDTLRNWSCT